MKVHLPTRTRLDLQDELRRRGEACVLEVTPGAAGAAALRIIEITTQGLRVLTVDRITPLAHALELLAATPARALELVCTATDAALLKAAQHVGCMRRSAPVRIAAVQLGWHAHMGQGEA